MISTQRPLKEINAPSANEWYYFITPAVQLPLKLRTYLVFMYKSCPHRSVPPDRIQEHGLKKKSLLRWFNNEPRGGITAADKNVPTMQPAMRLIFFIFNYVCHTCRDQQIFNTSLPVLAFIVAGVLWLLPFIAEIPIPYSVPGSRSEDRDKQENW